MWRGLQDASTRRLWVAAGLSVAVHAAIAVSVQRAASVQYPGGNASPLTSEQTALPLFARLATALGDSVLLTAAPVATAPAETAVQSAPAPHTALTAAQVDSAPTGAGSAYYFKSSELDRRPFPVNRIEVPVPESAAHQSGVVILRLRISETGRIDDAKIVMGTGIADFETTALREFLNARFHPGYRGNLPVRSEMTIEVTLSPPKNTARPQTAGAGNTQN